MTNIAKLLKDAPKGLKLYSPLFGEVEFEEVMDTDYMPIRVMKRGYGLRFDEYGRYMGNEYPDSECILFPSKDCRTWEGWKLPVEPNFKVGDWIVHIDGTSDVPVQVYGLKKDRYLVTNMLGSKGEVMLTYQDKWRLWTIEDAKDVDVLVYQDEIFLVNLVDNNSVLYHCCFDGNLVVHSFYAFSNEDLLHVQPATKEQRDLLFNKMKEAGYEWDEKKKELRKIKLHYDIKNFHAGMPVLVRDKDNNKWCYLIYSHYDNTYADGLCFNAGSVEWRQCIPFEGNEHLLGTTDMPSEEFINW